MKIENIGREELLKKDLKVNKKGIGFDSTGIIPTVEIDVEDTLYNTFKKFALKNLDKVCIRHNNVEMTYSEILKKADKLAASLDMSGVKEGDVVVLPIKNCIEVPISLLAINKIGAISKWVDTDKSAVEFYDDLKQTKFKFLIADICIKEKIESIASTLNINKNNSLFVDSSQFNENSEFIGFCKKGENIEFSGVDYCKERPAIIITSSGSTGLPKEMLHSAYSINSAVKKLTYTDYPIKGNLLTVIIPPYIGLGLITSLYTSMVCGGEAEIISDYTNPFILIQYINENKKRFKESSNNKKVLFFGAPMYFKAMVLKQEEIDDMSFIGAMMAAGSKIEEKQLEAMDELFKSKGCSVPVCNAYGQNEHCGGITYNTISQNKRGSAGKVAYGTRIMIVDPNTKEELPINSIGKIVEQSDSQFLGYNHNTEADAASKFIDKDGEEWFDTKDLGSFDADKFLHILDRESRCIIRFDNKVALAKIEEKILKSQIVEEAITVKVNIPGPFGVEQAPFTFVVSEKKYSYNEILAAMQSSDYPFTMLETPIAIEYIKKESIPYKNGKVNYKKLETIAQNMVDSSLKNNDEKSNEKTKKLI